MHGQRQRLNTRPAGIIHAAVYDDGCGGAGERHRNRDGASLGLGWWRNDDEYGKRVEESGNA
ncbi:MAG: hypothetical protein AMXMBFR57_23660 [Acidimicrobiia bacterium]